MPEVKTNIYAKLVNVMRECAYVQKDASNDYHRYKYASASAVLEKINQSLVKNNVASAVNTELVSLSDVVTAKGSTEHLATVKVIIELRDVDSGTTVTFSGLGSGQDVGDKAVMKAQTAAIKYGYLLGLCISTGDDPEADSRTDESSAFEPASQAKSVIKPRTTEVNSSEVADDMHCANCSTFVRSPKVRDFALAKWGKVYCFECGQKMR